MLFTRSFFSIALALSASVSALPYQVNLDFWPSIYKPAAGDVLTAGQEATVSWNTTLPSGTSPDEVGQTAGLYLAWIQPGSVSYQDLTLLQSDVPLYTGATPGSTVVSLPNETVTRSTYIFVLIGSSGDTSAQFTIESNTIANPAVTA